MVGSRGALARAGAARRMLRQLAAGSFSAATRGGTSKAAFECFQGSLTKQKERYTMARGKKKICRFGKVKKGRRKGQCLKHKRARKKR
jgi:hypothetical protein